MNTTSNTSPVSLATSAMLCNVTISCWSAKKVAKKESEELTDSKAASRKAAQVHKNLLADDQKLMAINKYAAETRNWLARTTVPWADNGLRLVSTRQFLEFKAELDKRKTEFDRLAQEFVREYPTRISAQAFKLGTMFDRGEYPSDMEVASKFAFTYTFLPIPDAGDFRVDVAEDIAAALREQYEIDYAARVRAVSDDLWGRLKEVLEKMVDRLGTDDTGKNKVFRDTLVSNALDVCDLLKAVNVTNDVKLEQARMQLERALTNVDAQTLREVDVTRDKVRKDAEDILAAFSF